MINCAPDKPRQNELDAFTDHLVGEIERLARAGVDFGALASNTPHLVFDELQRRSPIPLISIVEATCDAAQALGLKRVAVRHQLYHEGQLLSGRLFQSGHYHRRPRGR